MTSDDDKLAGIVEQQEQWFRDIAHEPEPPDLDRVKRRARIAINEDWLGGKLGHASVEGDVSLTGLTLRTQKRIAVTVAKERLDIAARERNARRRALRGRVLRLTGTIGLAAAACIAIFVGLPRTPTDTRADGFDRLAAFDAYEEGELTRMLTDLDKELNDLENRFDTVKASTIEEGLYDDLYESIDELSDDGEYVDLTAETDWT